MGVLKFAQVYCFPTKNVHVVIWWVWGSLAVVLPDFVATHNLGPLLAFLHVSHEREVLSHACAIIIPTKQVLVSIWIGHQLYIIIYCYPLTQTNVGFLFLWRPSLHMNAQRCLARLKWKIGIKCGRVVIHQSTLRKSLLAILGS